MEQTVLARSFTQTPAKPPDICPSGKLCFAPCKNDLLTTAPLRAAVMFSRTAPWLPWREKPLIQVVQVSGTISVAQVHHVSGHWCNLRSGLASATRPYRNITDDHLSQNLHDAQAQNPDTLFAFSLKHAAVADSLGRQLPAEPRTIAIRSRSSLRRSRIVVYSPRSPNRAERVAIAPARPNRRACLGRSRNPRAKSLR